MNANHCTAIITIIPTSGLNDSFTQNYYIMSSNGNGTMYIY